jgi:CRISPR-associated protein Cst1
VTIARSAKLDLTGNPFVDTGLAIVAALSDLNEVESLTIEHVRKVHGDGKRLSSWNGSLKNFTMVFTKNSLLTNPSIKDESKRIEMYRRVVGGLLDRSGHEELRFSCEACGAPRTLDFDRLCRSSLAAVGVNEQTRLVGRDWFPLAGSIGSDAQALPAASRTAHLCAKCLFAVHYLTLGLILLDGRLAIFQSTSTEFWYELVRDIVDEVQSRIKAGNFDTLGAKEGRRTLAKRLLGLFERLQTAARFGDIPRGTALHVWRFSNAGASPECEIEEIPNAALVFLWNAVRQGLRQEVETLIDSQKKKERPFFRCVTERSDYRGLYPRGRMQGASPELFALYQTEVCGRAPRTLQLAHRLAREAIQGFKPKDLKRLQREEAFSEPAIRNHFRSLMVRLAEQRDFNLDDYIRLFPYSEDDWGIEVRFDGWNLVRYYLHHADHRPAVLGDDSSTESSASPKLARIRYYAARIISEFVDARGKVRFQGEVLNRLGRGDISVPWLQRQFIHLAEKHVGFTYEAWERLCRVSSGQVFIRELLFQMRLLWIRWIGEDNHLTFGLPSLEEGSGLPGPVEKCLNETLSRYVEQRGLERFGRDILIRLRKNEIALAWFRHQLTREAEEPQVARPLSKDDWEDFLKDDEGHSRVGERLFQMQLMVANVYRELDRKREGAHEQ